MIAIKNAVLVMKDHFIPNAVLLIENGRIVGFDEERLKQIPAECDVIDAEGLYVGPGFVDIHTHAGGKYLFREDPAHAAKIHLSHGTTTLFPALYFNMDTKGYLEEIELIRSTMKTADGENIGGLYMEGPYLNPKFGAERESNPWTGPVDREKYAPIVDAAYDLAKVWALAPERPHILEFVEAVKKKNPNAVFAVGHSEASPQEIEALIPYGLKIGTHHTNATGDRVKYPECRGVCVDETVNYNREIYAEMICDSRGIHVDPYMLRLVRRIKGDDRIILISDAYTSDAPVPEGYEGVDDILFDYSQEIAGTKLTLDVACRNMIKHTGASLVDVFKFASYNPAMASGLYDRGEIAVGKRADLVIVDHGMKVHGVFMNGEVVK